MHTVILVIGGKQRTNTSMINYNETEKNSLVDYIN